MDNTANSKPSGNEGSLNVIADIFWAQLVRGVYDKEIKDKELLRVLKSIRERTEKELTTINS